MSVFIKRSFLDKTSDIISYIKVKAYNTRTLAIHIISYITRRTLGVYYSSEKKPFKASRLEISITTVTFPGEYAHYSTRYSGELRFKRTPCDHYSVILYVELTTK